MEHIDERLDLACESFIGLCNSIRTTKGGKSSVPPHLIEILYMAYMLKKPSKKDNYQNHLNFIEIDDDEQDEQKLRRLKFKDHFTQMRGETTYRKKLEGLFEYVKSRESRELHDKTRQDKKHELMSDISELLYSYRTDEGLSERAEGLLDYKIHVDAETLHKYYTDLKSNPVLRDVYVYDREITLNTSEEFIESIQFHWREYARKSFVHDDVSTFYNEASMEMSVFLEGILDSFFFKKGKVKFFSYLPESSSSVDRDEDLQEKATPIILIAFQTPAKEGFQWTVVYLYDNDGAVEILHEDVHLNGLPHYMQCLLCDLDIELTHALKTQVEIFVAN